MSNNPYEPTDLERAAAKLCMALSAYLEDGQDWEAVRAAHGELDDVLMDCLSDYIAEADAQCFSCVADPLHDLKANARWN